MNIGDEVYIRGYVDTIHKDTVIIRNNGGYYFGVPKADCVEIIRCKDCKKGENNGHGCARYDVPVEPDDFCSYGERKEE